MSNERFTFDHVHIISEDPVASAAWYVEILDATITATYKLRGALQIHVALAGMTVIIRGKRSEEDPSKTNPIRDFGDYSSHNEWGTDHFGFTFNGDLEAFCEEIREKGATFAVEPWEFSPASLLCYLAAPDGVSIELVQVQR
jgi:lactoylglutathione lyase